MSFFTAIPCSKATMDLYLVRTALFKALQTNLSVFNGDLLDIGCGQMPYRQYILEHSKVTSYIGLDIENALPYNSSVKPDYTWNGITMPFSDEQYDCAFGTEVLEHCPDPKIILSETYRVLKPGSPFFFTVPFLWPLHEVPHDEYRYTPFALQRMLSECGFKKIEIKALGGWNASMAQMLGLWLRRSKMSDRRRNILSTILYPFYLYLIKTDKVPTVFHESTMITGLSGIAYK